MTEPFRLKYQLIVLRPPWEQPSSGVYWSETFLDTSSTLQTSRCTYASRTVLKRGYDIRQRVRLICGRRNTSVREPSVRGESLEQFHDCLAVCHSLRETKSALCQISGSLTTYLSSLGTARWEAARFERAIGNLISEKQIEARQCSFHLKHVPCVDHSC